jgi:2-polyprenyl-3-methyl-5-hydroxy-6-metoxy-1,4-benzoquinol methylase
MERYDSSYFNEEYRRQYGRTYVEDFASIKKIGLSRIRSINRLLGRADRALAVDIGCAYGPFLEALKDSGFSPVGVDISSDAVGYVKEKLGLPAVLSDFDGLAREMLPPQPIRVLTFWYVIEHIKDLDGALKKASTLLAADGVLAISTPNGSGVSARKSLRRFLEQSPADHYTVLSARRISALLGRYGFRLKEVRVMGHHPERFPAPLRALSRIPWMRRVIYAASVMFGLGDTFEAYAVKRETQ